MDRKTLAVDFDGTLARYDGWKGPEVVGGPLPGAVGWMEEVIPHFHLAVFSTRAKEAKGKAAIQAWLSAHLGPETASEVEVTHEKIPAIAYLDDKAIHFSGAYPKLSDLQALVAEAAHSPYYFLRKAKPVTDGQSQRTAQDEGYHYGVVQRADLARALTNHGFSNRSSRNLVRRLGASGLKEYLLQHIEGRPERVQRQWQMVCRMCDEYEGQRRETARRAKEAPAGA